VTEMCESQDLKQAAGKVSQRISSEPALKIVLYKILSFCESAHTYPEIWHEISSYPEMKNALQTPPVLLKWLVEAGGIGLISTEEREPTWETTPAGRKVIQDENAGSRLERLLTEDPVYRDIFIQALQSCVVPMSRIAIESTLKGNALLESSKLYPGYFIEALERAGGLEWNGQWRTTKAGQEFLEQECCPAARTNTLNS